MGMVVRWRSAGERQAVTPRVLRASVKAGRHARRRSATEFWPPPRPARGASVSARRGRQRMR